MSAESLIENKTDNDPRDSSLETEDWSESAFLGASISIMTAGGIVTIAAILLVIRANWKLQNYSNIYNNSSNNDTDSSIQSSLKRYFM